MPGGRTAHNQAMSAGDKERSDGDRRGIASNAKGAALFRLGVRLKKARQKSGLTQNEVAGEIGVTAQTVRNWEAGRNEPPRSAIRKLASLYGVTEEEFLENLDVPIGNPVSAKPKFPYDRVNVNPERLSRARREAGLTQERVSGMTGLSLSVIRSYERGSARPATGTLGALASIYNKPAGWFMPLGHFTEEEERLYQESVGPQGEIWTLDLLVMAAYDRARSDLREEAKQRIINFIRLTHRQEISGQSSRVPQKRGAPTIGIQE